jgi:hypothetical protein
MGLKLMQFSAAGLMYFYAGNDTIGDGGISLPEKTAL